MPTRGGTMQTLLVGITCAVIGVFIGVFVMSLIASGRRTEYDIDGVVDWLNSCQNPKKAVYLIIRRVLPNHHLHENPPRKLRAIA
jgi:hypothetical protein